MLTLLKLTCARVCASIADGATHGPRCTLSRVHKSTVSPTLRETMLVDIWRKLTADSRSVGSELYAEARLCYRRRIDNGARTPSVQMRAWLEMQPNSLFRGGTGRDIGTSGQYSPPRSRSPNTKVT